MKVETPQILWHSEGTRGGKNLAAALSGISLIESGCITTCNIGSNSSSGSSATNVGDIPMNSSESADATIAATVLLSTPRDIAAMTATTGGTTTTPTYCVATAGNSNEVHLWRVAFNSPPGGPNSNNALIRNDNNDKMSDESASASNANVTDEVVDLTASSPLLPSHSVLCTKRPSPISTVDSPTEFLSKRRKEASNPSKTNSSNMNSNSSSGTQIEFLCALTRHGGPVSAASFSPNARHLATASAPTGCVIVWSVPVTAWAQSRSTTNSCAATTAGECTTQRLAQQQQRNDYWVNSVRKESDLTMQIAARTCEGVNDISWSSDSKRLVVCTIDHTILILENVNHDSINSNAGAADSTAKNPDWQVVYRNTSFHTHYIQGVAFDPSNAYIASQSSDRTVRILQRKLSATATAAAVSAAANGNMSIASGSESTATAAASVVDPKNILKPTNQYPNCRSDCSTGSSVNSALPNPEVAAVMSRLLTDGKLDISNKTRQIKFRTAKSANTVGTKSNLTPCTTATMSAESSDPALNAPVPSNKQYWYLGETMLNSFVRRLAWTVDGAYLVTPAAMWPSPNKSDGATDQDVVVESNQQPGVSSGVQNSAISKGNSDGASGSYATLLFQRHRFDEPWKVLGGLDKPSIAVRPNPVLFRLPPSSSTIASPTSLPNNVGIIATSTDDAKENCSLKNVVPSTTQQYPLPYRNIFAVLTWDSVLIYDTIHDQPLAVVRGIHYAHLVDAVWTPDGRSLFVCSTDGYVSILRFDAGELGEVYIPPLVPLPANVAASSHATHAGAQTTANSAVSPSLSSPSRTSTKSLLVAIRPPSSLPPCEPGPVSVHCPPAKRAKTRITPTLVVTDSSDIAAEASTTVENHGGLPASESHKRTATEAAIAVDRLSLADDGAGISPATMVITAVQPAKKQKKRIPLMSVS